MVRRRKNTGIASNGDKHESAESSSDDGVLRDSYGNTYGDDVSNNTVSEIDRWHQLLESKTEPLKPGNRWADVSYGVYTCTACDVKSIMWMAEGNVIWPAGKTRTEEDPVIMNAIKHRVMDTVCPWTDDRKWPASRMKVADVDYEDGPVLKHKRTIVCRHCGQEVSIESVCGHPIHDGGKHLHWKHGQWSEIGTCGHFRVQVATPIPVGTQFIHPDGIDKIARISPSTGELEIVDDIDKLTSVGTVTSDMDWDGDW